MNHGDQLGHGIVGLGTLWDEESHTGSATVSQTTNAYRGSELLERARCRGVGSSGEALTYPASSRGHCSIPTYPQASNRVRTGVSLSTRRLYVQSPHTMIDRPLFAILHWPLPPWLRLTTHFYTTEASHSSLFVFSNMPMICSSTKDVKTAYRSLFKKKNPPCV